MQEEIREYVIYIVSDGTHCFALPVIHKMKLMKTKCRILEYAVCTRTEAMEIAARHEKELGIPGDGRLTPGNDKATAQKEKPKKWKRRQTETKRKN